MTVQIKKSASLSTSLVKLSDLRDLVMACEGMPPNASVNISIDPGEYNQGSYYTITVSER